MFCCIRQINNKIDIIDDDIELIKQELIDLRNENKSLIEKCQKNKKDISRIVTLYSPKEFIVFKLVLLTKTQLNDILKSVHNDLEKEFKISLCDPKICSVDNFKGPEEARNGGGPLKNPFTSIPPNNIRKLTKLNSGLDSTNLTISETMHTSAIWARLQTLTMMYSLFKDFVEKIHIYRAKNYDSINGNLGIIHKWEHTKYIAIAGYTDEIMEIFFDSILKSILN